MKKVVPSFGDTYRNAIGTLAILVTQSRTAVFPGVAILLPLAFPVFVKAKASRWAAEARWKAVP